MVQREGAGEHPIERTRRCVSEGAQTATPAMGRISADPYLTSMPMERAVPSICFIAASMLLALRSAILTSAIWRT